MNDRSMQTELVRALFAAASDEVVPAASRVDVARRLGLAAAGGELPAQPREPRRPLAPSTNEARALRFELGWLGLMSGLLVGAPAPGSLVPRAATLAVVPAPMSTLAAPTPTLSEVRTATPPVAARVTSPPPMPLGTARSGSGSEGVSHAVRSRSRLPREVVTRAANTLIDEVKTLDRARSALRDADGPAALRELDSYERRFSGGELALEARVLRVAALVASARGDAARALAREILAAPGSARYRAELRRLMQEHRL